MGQNFASPSAAGPVVSQAQAGFGQPPPVRQPAFTPAQAIDMLLQMQKEMYDKAATYTKLIVGLGYAGFFTAWSGAHELLSPRIRVASALLVTFSLLVFVAFEVFEMLQRGMLLRAFHRVVRSAPERLQAELINYGTAEKHSVNRFMRVWILSLWLTILPGAAGGILAVVRICRAGLGSTIGSCWPGILE